MKKQLIKQLLRFNDMAAAAKWAKRLNIAMEYLPFALQAYIETEPLRYDSYLYFVFLIGSMTIPVCVVIKNSPNSKKIIL